MAAVKFFPYLPIAQLIFSVVVVITETISGFLKIIMRVTDDAKLADLASLAQST